LIALRRLKASVQRNLRFDKANPVKAGDAKPPV
jgi:hypothetical protein